MNKRLKGFFILWENNKYDRTKVKNNKYVIIK